MTLTKRLIMAEIKIPALKTDFIEMLYNKWQNDYSGQKISVFLYDINEDYGQNLKDFCAPGETGVYIDDDVLFKLNTHTQAGKEKAIWDKECSFDLYNTPGLFTLDNENNRVHLKN